MTTQHNKQEREKYTEAAKKAGEEIEKKADEAIDGGISIMQKLKDKKWSAAALVGAGLALAFWIGK